MDVKIKYLLGIALWGFPLMAMERKNSESGEYYFERAIEENDERAVSRWIAEVLHRKLDINAKDKYGRNPLIMAASTGKLNIVKQLLNCPGINVNARDDFAGRTA